jgi:hypothetical protein
VTDLTLKDHPSPALKLALLCAGAAFLATFGVFTLLWAKYINPYYFPYGDNFSLLTNSIPPFHPSYSAWFLHGFQTYFDVYPDMSLHGSDFIRPLVNGTFFLGWFVYGSHWSRYLLTTYAIIGMIAGTTCFMASYVLKLGWRLTILAVICVSIAPSVDAGAISDPTFAFDLLAGLFVLMGVAALISDALIAAGLLLTLAIFTKETALFAPALAAAIVYFRKDDKPRFMRAATSFCFLLPLAVWLALRWHDFRGERGVYVFMDGSSHGAVHVILVRFVLGLTTWPVAATVFWSSIPLTLRLLQKASLVIDIGFWIVLAWVAFTKLMKCGIHIAAIRASLRARGEKYAILLLSLFCATSLLVPLSLNAPRRFGGVFYPLFILCMASAAGYSRSRGLRTASAAMLATIAVAGALLISSDFRTLIPTVRFAWAMSRDYISQLSASREPAIFIVDDLSGRYASNESIKQFSGYQGRLIRVNDLQWNFTCAADARITVLQLPGGGVGITSLVPEQCGDHAFNAVFPPFDPRTTTFTRDLPNVTLHYNLVRQADPLQPISGVNKMQVELQPALQGSSILLPDLSGLHYRKIPLESRTGAGAQVAPQSIN